MGIISFSLWGSHPIYLLGMLENIITAPIFYPGYQVWIYLSTTVPKRYRQIFAKFNYVIIILRDDEDSMANSLWRFEPAFYSDQVVLFRDADSRFSQREVQAVKEWLDSECNVHVMRDHDTHRSKIMAGMWGVRKGCLRKYQDDFLHVIRYNYYGVDEAFLAEKIYDRITDTMFVHDSHPREGEIVHPFIDNEDGTHVGEIVTSAPTAGRFLGWPADRVMHLEKEISDG